MLHFIPIPIKRESNKMYLVHIILDGDQCDRMASAFAQYFSKQNNVNYPNSKKYLPKRFTILPPAIKYLLKKWPKTFQTLHQWRISTNLVTLMGMGSRPPFQTLFLLLGLSLLTLPNMFIKAFWQNTCVVYQRDMYEPKGYREQFLHTFAHIEIFLLNHLRIGEPFH